MHFPILFCSETSKVSNDSVARTWRQNVDRLARFPDEIHVRVQRVVWREEGSHGARILAVGRLELRLVGAALVVVAHRWGSKPGVAGHERQDETVASRCHLRLPSECSVQSPVLRKFQILFPWLSAVGTRELGFLFCQNYARFIQAAIYRG